MQRNIGPTRHMDKMLEVVTVLGAKPKSPLLLRHIWSLVEPGRYPIYMVHSDMLKGRLRMKRVSNIQLKLGGLSLRAMQSGSPTLRLL